MGAGPVIILDTHIFVWMLLSADKIPSNIVANIADETVLGIPAISLWEIAMLVDKGRIVLSEPVLPWLKRALLSPKIRLVPISPEIAVRSGALNMHGDPADRLIAATALELHCALATVDNNLLAFPDLLTL
jgi:PIN domain nuclease of toxin-antitoxin system